MDGNFVGPLFVSNVRIVRSGQIAEEKHDLGVMWTSRPFLDEDHAFLKQLNRYREAKGLKDVMLLESPSSGSQMNTPSTTDIGEKILFDSVVVGGTFDRLHAGHRLLLSTCVLITRQRLMVGMTGEQKTNNRSLLV